MVPHPRDLKPGYVGTDVFAFKRALHMALGDDAGLRQLMHSTAAVQQMWGQSTTTLYHLWQKQEKTQQSNTYDRFNHNLLSPWYDPYGIYLISKQRILAMCYPQPDGWAEDVCQGLHQTEGLPGNWAIDFCAPGGTPILAVEAGRISRWSGHDPALGTVNGITGKPDPTSDIFGWSMYLSTDSGYVYFMTHCGSRSATVGTRVEVGDEIGAVGHWPHDEGRSHTHLGVTSSKGARDAQTRITQVSKSPKLKV